MAVRLLASASRRVGGVAHRAHDTAIEGLFRGGVPHGEVLLRRDAGSCRLGVAGGAVRHPESVLVLSRCCCWSGHFFLLVLEFFPRTTDNHRDFHPAEGGSRMSLPLPRLLLVDEALIGFVFLLHPLRGGDLPRGVEVPEVVLPRVAGTRFLRRRRHIGTVPAGLEEPRVRPLVGRELALELAGHVMPSN